MPIPQTLSDSVEKYGLGYIRPRHNEIARRLVCGQKPVEIQRIMGYSTSRFSIIINSPLFKIVIARLAKLRDESTIDIQEELAELQPVALGEIAKVAMTSPSEKLRLDASKDILDRGGTSKKDNSGGIGIQINFDPVNLEDYRGNKKPSINITAVQPMNDTIDVAPTPEKKKLDTPEDNMKLLDEILAEMK